MNLISLWRTALLTKTPIIYNWCFSNTRKWKVWTRLSLSCWSESRFQKRASCSHFSLQRTCSQPNSVLAWLFQGSSCVIHQGLSFLRMIFVLTRSSFVIARKNCCEILRREKLKIRNQSRQFAKCFRMPTFRELLGYYKTSSLCEELASKKPRIYSRKDSLMPAWSWCWAR